ncbi:MAG: class I SAM-dependent methyltransferase [Vicinamibacterales bacterium]
MSIEPPPAWQAFQSFERDGWDRVAAGYAALVEALGVGEARRRYPAITFREGAAEAIPLPDASVDAVISAWGLPHFAQHQLVFKEARRVLRAGGRLAMATWRPPPGNQFFGILLGSLLPHLQQRPPLPEGPDLFHFADHATAERALRACGFTDISCTDISFDAPLPNGAADLVAFLRAGSVRSQVLYLAQDAERRQRIEADIVAAANRLAAPALRLERS